MNVNSAIDSLYSPLFTELSKHYGHGHPNHFAYCPGLLDCRRPDWNYPGGTGCYSCVAGRVIRMGCKSVNAASGTGSFAELAVPANLLAERNKRFMDGQTAVPLFRCWFGISNAWEQRRRQGQRKRKVLITKDKHRVFWTYKLGNTKLPAQIYWDAWLRKQAA